MTYPYRSAPASRMFVTSIGATDLAEVIDVWRYSSATGVVTWKVQFRNIPDRRGYTDKDGKALFAQWLAYRKEQG